MIVTVNADCCFQTTRLWQCSQLNKAVYKALTFLSLCHYDHILSDNFVHRNDMYRAADCR